jgi:pimeloyl-ACP methyl ester carboxylesterase
MRMGFRALFAAWLFLSAVAGHAQGCTTPKGPAYLDGRDRGRLSVIVFVHGVLSNSESAWSNGDVSWPCLLRREPSFGSSNIYVHAYPTNLLDKNPTIEELGQRLLEDLRADDVLERHTHITFVAHSMGGLVTASMLLRLQASAANRQWLERVKVVTFYATPGTGADIARAAEYLSPNLQFPDIAKASAIADRWLKVKWPFAHRCFAEGRRTGWWLLFGTNVVPQTSASRLCDGQEPPAEVLFAYDHLQIVKPASLQDEPHRHLYRVFKACVGTALPVPDAVSHSNASAAFAAFAELQSALADGTFEGKRKRQEVIEGLLVQGGPANGYFIPRTLDANSLRDADYDRLAFRVFANQVVNHFQAHAAALRATWATPVNALPLRVRDGRIVELTQRWLDAGLLAADDAVMAADGPEGQFLFVFQANDAVAARLKGVIAVPPLPSGC